MGVAAVLAVSVAVGAAACSNEDTSPSTVDGDFSTDVAILPGTDTAAEGARTDVTEETCERRDGAWVSAGTVTNSADSPRAYRIYTGFVDASGETRGLVQSDVTNLQPNERQQWESAAAIGELDGVRCVLRVERVVPTA
jgi:hypothetical protein